eukprot:TRINITY_DN36577_c0_g1_i1.p1 TRINITY_DN36577_c0_g1~~TRINITY_DN36577_c0_g1_i1.p1  ORF type:complete len:156 (+),score=55.22 TRINITY_DN36577_c0_g1_i1:55-522(+)
MSLTDQQLKEAFTLFDQDNSGEIDADELKHAVKGLGYKITPEEIDEMLSKIDKDGNASISFDEFKRMLRGREVARDSGEEIDAAFDSFDAGKKGYINVEDVVKVGILIGDINDESESLEKARKKFDYYMESASSAGNGQMTREDWRTIMKKMKGR